MAYLGRDAANAVTSPRRGVAGIRLTFVLEMMPWAEFHPGLAES
jgi:hypothetical protein